MAKEADLFAEARGGVNKAQEIINEDNNINLIVSRPDIKCSFCGKGYSTIKCYKNRKEASM